MSMLEIKSLSVSFKNRKNEIFQAVNNANLKLDKSEILGIVGESGSGKSVTAMAILGLLPYPRAFYSDSSSIVYNNQELIGLSNKEYQKIRGNDISFIFQEPMSSLNPLHKIGKQIAETLKIHQNLTSEQIKERTLELLKMVKIPNPEQKINAYPFELSGGQRQRVMIAMAIANNPRILIADEPTTALDVTIQEEIIDLLLELKNKLDMAIIFISHNIRLVHRIADNIAVMYNGKVIEYGTAKQIFENPVESYTKELISSNLLLKTNENMQNYEILRVDSINVTFPIKKSFWGKVVSELKAVSNVSFSLNSGETLGIVGESGSGKTTLAMSLVNLVKHTGNISLKINEIECENNLQNIQIVFQDPYNSLNPRKNTEEIVGEGLDVHFPKLSVSERNRKINNIIHEVGLSSNILSKNPQEFSAGPRQRIALARV